MAQFRIKTTKNEVLCPNEMEKHDKKSLYDKCEKENVRLFCNCNGVCDMICMVFVYSEHRRGTKDL